MFNEVPRNILYGWKVVVVDDDPKSLDIAASLLAFYGANVHCAKNGQEGIDLARKVRPDFLITDLSMPTLNGWELIRILKEDRTTLEIPIIALTAHTMTDFRSKAIAMGCHNFLSKPLTPYTFVKDLLTLLVDIPELAIRLQSSR